ncbi:his operon leader peptide [Photorhabdus tasmaniensis]
MVNTKNSQCKKEKPIMIRIQFNHHHHHHPD